MLAVVNNTIRCCRRAHNVAENSLDAGEHLSQLWQWIVGLTANGRVDQLRYLVNKDGSINCQVNNETQCIVPA